MGKKLLTFFNLFNLFIMYQLSFHLQNVGQIEVSFDVNFGGIKELYVGLKPSFDKFYYSSLSQKIKLVSIKTNDSFNFKWDRLSQSELRIEILKQILDIKSREDGNYIQSAKYNWLP